MSLILLHGDNLAGLRERLSQIKEEAKLQGKEVLSFDARTSEFSEIALAARSQTLDGYQPLVVVENFFSAKRKVAGPLLGDVVFLEEKKLTQDFLTKLPSDWKIEEISFPKVVFQFLDSLIPGNKNLVFDLHQVYLVELPEKILPLLAWHVRLLIWAKMEPQTLRFWKKEKLIKQAQKFSTEQLFWLHRRLLELDLGQKTSTLPSTLLASLDQLAIALSE